MTSLSLVNGSQSKQGAQIDTKGSMLKLGFRLIASAMTPDCIHNVSKSIYQPSNRNFRFTGMQTSLYYFLNHTYD